MDNIIFATKDLFLNYINFKGRLPRAAYWWAYLGYFILAVIVSIISVIIDLDIIVTLFSLICILPLLSAAVRRFHDVGKSGVIVAIIYVINFVSIFVAIIALIYGVVSAFTIGDGFLPGFIVFILGIIVSFITGIYEIIVLASKPDGPNIYGNPETFEEYKAART